MVLVQVFQSWKNKEIMAQYLESFCYISNVSFEDYAIMLVKPRKMYTMPSIKVRHNLFLPCD